MSQPEPPIWMPLSTTGGQVVTKLTTTDFLPARAMAFQTSSAFTSGLWNAMCAQSSADRPAGARCNRICRGCPATHRGDGCPVGRRRSQQRHHGVQGQHAVVVDWPARAACPPAIAQQRRRNRPVQAEDQNLAWPRTHRGNASIVAAVAAFPAIIASLEGMQMGIQQELRTRADHVAIQDLMARYAYAVDAKRWDGLAEVLRRPAPKLISWQMAASRIPGQRSATGSR